MPRISSRRKVRGTARTTALKLFGVPGKMERPSDRENIVLILRHSPSPQVRELCRRASDLIYRSTSFAQLAEHLGLNYHDLAKEYKEIQRSMGYVRAAAHLPDLMEQVALDAKSVWKLCKRCKGTKVITITPSPKEVKALKASEEYMQAVVDGDKETVDRIDLQAAPHDVECPSCDGEGKIYQLGDVDRLRMALEMFALTNKTGAGVNVNLDLRSTDKPESLESLSETVAGITLDAKISEPQ